MKLWEFRTRNFIVKCYTEPDTLDTRYLDPALAKECREKVRSGEWKCFQTTVEVKHRLSGEIVGEDSMGGSIYADPKDFYREHFGIRAKSRRDNMNYGCYFTDMVNRACEEARKRMKELRKERQSALARLNEGKVK